jgi:uncharacterized membrane protein
MSGICPETGTVSGIFVSDMAGLLRDLPTRPATGAPKGYKEEERMGEAIANVLDRQDWLGEASDALQPAIKECFEAGGEAGQAIKNFLHGKWLGHPLHPALTDIPIGAWTAALALDAMEMTTGRKELAAGADAAIAVGLVGAVGAAITGMTDWSETGGRARKVGLTHGLLNLSAALLYGTSLAVRDRKSRSARVGLSMLAYAVASASAYLGGHLVFKEGVGVSSADR